MTHLSLQDPGGQGCHEVSGSLLPPTLDEQVPSCVPLPLELFAPCGRGCEGMQQPLHAMEVTSLHPGGLQWGAEDCQGPWASRILQLPHPPNWQLGNMQAI